jgi:hypothetical protein
MIPGVVPDQVPSRDDAPRQIRLRFSAIAQQEKRRLHIVAG